MQNQWTNPREFRGHLDTPRLPNVWVKEPLPLVRHWIGFCGSCQPPGTKAVPSLLPDGFTLVGLLPRLDKKIQGQEPLFSSSSITFQLWQFEARVSEWVCDCKLIIELLPPKTDQFIRFSKECKNSWNFFYSPLNLLKFSQSKNRISFKGRARSEPWGRSQMWVGMNWAPTSGISGAVSDGWQRCKGDGGFSGPFKPHLQVALYTYAQQSHPPSWAPPPNSRLQWEEMSPFPGQKAPVNHCLHLRCVDLLKWDPNVSLLSITFINGS